MEFFEKCTIFDESVIKDIIITKSFLKDYLNHVTPLYKKKPSALSNAVHESIFGTAATINKELNRLNDVNKANSEPGKIELTILKFYFNEPLADLVLTCQLSDAYSERELRVIDELKRKIDERKESIKLNELNNNSKDVFEEIKKLKELYDLSIISKEEFEEKKAELLKKI